MTKPSIYLHTRETDFECVQINSSRLDPITLFYNDYGDGRCKFVIEIYGKAWSAFFSSMGKDAISFLIESNVQYLIDAFIRGRTHEIDYKTLSVIVGEPVTVETVRDHSTALEEYYGPDWAKSLPQRNTQEYWHLSRIFSAIKASPLLALKKPTESHAL